MEMDTQTICEKTGLSEDSVGRLLAWSKVEPDSGVVFPTSINAAGTVEAVKVVDQLIRLDAFCDLVNHVVLHRHAKAAMPYNRIALNAFAQNWRDVQKVLEDGSYDTAPSSIKSQIDFQRNANISLTMMTPGMIMAMEEWKANKTIMEIASALLDGRKDAEDGKA